MCNRFCLDHLCHVILYHLNLCMLGAFLSGRAIVPFAIHYGYEKHFIKLQAARVSYGKGPYCCMSATVGEEEREGL